MACRFLDQTAADPYQPRDARGETSFGGGWTVAFVNRPLARALLLALALAGCTETYPAYPVVPQPLVERVPEPPASSATLSWRPGYYDWADGQYVWIAGEWVPLAGHGATWQDGYWQRIGPTTYQWVRAQWK